MKTKFKPILDDEQYIIELRQGEGDETLEFDLEESRKHPLFCFKVINNKAIYQEERYQEYLKKEEAKKEIIDVQKELESYDYIGTKIAMGVATRDDYTEEIAHTEELRKKMRELKKIIEE